MSHLGHGSYIIIVLKLIFLKHEYTESLQKLKNCHLPKQGLHALKGWHNSLQHKVLVCDLALAYDVGGACEI